MQTSPRVYSRIYERFTEYEVIEDQNKNLIIVPKSTDKVLYNPIIEPKILEDFLRLGKVIPTDTPYEYIDKKKKESISKAILRFVNKYGILKLYLAFSPSMNPYFYNKDKYSSFGYEYERLEMFSFATGEKELLVPNTSEPVELFIDAVMYLYSHSKAWDAFSKNSFGVDDIYNTIPEDHCLTNFENMKYLFESENITWESRLSTFFPSSISPSISFNGKWEMVYRYITLFDALCLTYMQRITSNHPQSQIRYCKLCGDIISSLRSPKAEFCCESCRNNYNVKRHREKANK